MFKKLETSTSEILILEASGEITAEDYTNVLIPEMQKLIDSNRSIRCVISFDDTFTNFTFAAMIQDGLFGMKNITHFEKISLIGIHSWIENLIDMAEHIAPNVIKKFEPAEMQEALVWGRS